VPPRLSLIAHFEKFWGYQWLRAQVLQSDRLVNSNTLTGLSELCHLFDVDSTWRAAELPYVCCSWQKPFLNYVIFLNLSFLICKKKKKRQKKYQYHEKEDNVYKALEKVPRLILRSCWLQTIIIILATVNNNKIIFLVAWSCSTNLSTGWIHKKGCPD